MSAVMDGLDKLVPQVTSKSVEDMLGMLTLAKESLSMAHGELDFCDRKTQDLLHEIELCELSYHERARLAIELSTIRQRRRSAKDIIDTLTPLAEWESSQNAAINQLKQCLGAMRKVESKFEGRVYYKRACDAGENFIVVDGKNKNCEKSIF